MTAALQLVEGDAPKSGFAPLRNMDLLDELVSRLADRPSHLPGLGCFSGPSGWGKSFAAAYCAARHRAYYVEARSAWTRSAMLQAVLRELGIQAGHTIAEMVDQVAAQLATSRRVLIVDEMDHVVQRGLVELVRDVYELSQGAVILIGEENLPQKLKRFERFHGRILEWVQALPCDLGDARELACFYAPRVEVADDLLERLVEVTHGSARRVCVNLERIRIFAAGARLERVDLASWGERELHTGEPPASRTFRR